MATKREGRVKKKGAMRRPAGTAKPTPPIQYPPPRRNAKD